MPKHLLKRNDILAKPPCQNLIFIDGLGSISFAYLVKKQQQGNKQMRRKEMKREIMRKKKLLSAIGHPIFSHLKTLSRCQWTKSSPKLLDSSSPPKKSKFEARKVRYGAQTFCWWWPWHQLFVGPNVVTALWVC